MSTCEYGECKYRVTQKEAAHIFVENVLHPVTSSDEDIRQQGAIVEGERPYVLCQVKMNAGDPTPICELPNMPDTNCPIAQHADGYVTFDEANAALIEIFNAGKSAQE